MQELSKPSSAQTAANLKHAPVGKLAAWAARRRPARSPAACLPEVPRWGHGIVETPHAMRRQGLASWRRGRLGGVGVGASFGKLGVWGAALRGAPCRGARKRSGQPSQPTPQVPHPRHLPRNSAVPRPLRSRGVAARCAWLSAATQHPPEVTPEESPHSEAPRLWCRFTAYAPPLPARGGQLCRGGHGLPSVADHKFRNCGQGHPCPNHCPLIPLNFQVGTPPPAYDSSQTNLEPEWFEPKWLAPKNTRASCASANSRVSQAANVHKASWARGTAAYRSRSPRPERRQVGVGR